MRGVVGSSAVLAASHLNAWAAPQATVRPSNNQKPEQTLPWFRRAQRWGQVNLAELDPTRIDLNLWRAQWRSTALQGVVVNAGGIVAYYPTEVPLHRRAQFLGKRDLFGELRSAAAEDGLAVFARMDSNRADESFYRAHQDWFAEDAEGKPYRVTELFVACVNSPYYTDYIPAILREIATRYHPEGFTDNNWNGPMRDQPCFCGRCEQLFRARTGEPIPRKTNWDDPVYREWISWNYARRLEIWDHFNRVTREAGGPACLWIGMMAGNQSWQSRVFRDDREIYRRTEMVMLDDQRRPEAEGFPHNGEVGKRIHSVGGWGKLIPESMAMYQAGEHNFRLAAKPEAEVRLWFCEGVAGGVQPWWHHVGAVQPDRRMLKTAPALWQWHRDHEQYLVDRQPVATVGVIWSQRNMDYFGRDEPASQVDDPWNGFTLALVRARIPYLPVHLDDVEKVVAEFGLCLLVLPNIGAISDAQAEALRAFVRGGGNLVATGLTSLFDEAGQPRRDFALADVMGVHLQEGLHPCQDPVTRMAWGKSWQQTYLGLQSDERAGGNQGDAVSSALHPILRGLEETDVLAFGGRLVPLAVAKDAKTLLTYIPPVPVSPPEAVWIHETNTAIPGLVIRGESQGSRVAYLPADLDRRYARDSLPDHANLLANLVRWAAHDRFPLKVEGAGLLDCHLYQQQDRLVLHLVNLTNAGAWRSPVDELTPAGPFQVSLDLPAGMAGSIRSLVTGVELATSVGSNRVHFEISSIRDHDVLLVS